MNDIIFIKQVTLNPEQELTINYCITERSKEFLEIGDMNVFGLKVSCVSNCGHNILVEECTVEDISTDRDSVAQLAGKLADNLAFPVHLRDIVMDYIS